MVRRALTVEIDEQLLVVARTRLRNRATHARDSSRSAALSRRSEDRRGLRGAHTAICPSRERPT